MLQLKTKNVRNFTTQNVTKLKNSKQDKPKKNQIVTKTRKNQIVTKLICLNCDKAHKLKFWQNS